VRFLLQQQLPQQKDAGAQFRVRAAVRNTEKAEAQTLKQWGAELIVVDPLRPDTLDKALEDVDRLALIVPFVAEMSVLAQNWIAAVERHAGVTHISSLSVLGADGEHVPMSSAHHDIEQRIRRLSQAAANHQLSRPELTWCFVRPNTFMSDVVLMCADSARSSGKLLAPLGDARVAYIDPRDVGEVLALAIVQSSLHGKIINLNGRESLTGSETAAVLSKLLNRAVTYTSCSDEEARANMKAAGVSGTRGDSLIQLYTLVRAGLFGNADDSVRDVLGRDAIEMRQFLQDHLAAFKLHV